VIDIPEAVSGNVAACAAASSASIHSAERNSATAGCYGLSV
jgi:hypothetical protein